MTSERTRILQQLVTLYDEREAPVTPRDLTAASDQDHEAVQAALRSFRDCDLAVETGAGIRPTVTARELLELPDVEGGVVVDPCEETDPRQRRDDQ